MASGGLEPDLDTYLQALIFDLLPEGLRNITGSVRQATGTEADHDGGEILVL
jgi:hypothetical protein